METKHPFDFQMHFPRPKIAANEPKGRESIVSAIMKISDAKKSISEKFKNRSRTAYGRADEYEVLNEIGKGTYGIVYRAREKKTGQIVAMKKEVHGLSRSSWREINILQSLVGRPWFVEFKQVVVDEYKGVYVVMEYMENDLKRFMDGNTGTFILWEVKYLMRQMLEGVAFLHENGIMHRDLKPSNILLRNNGNLKICDFGLSKRFERKVDCHSHRVGSLWYKAPELLTEAERYSCAVDMWSVGCIMAEMLLNQVLFKGYSENEQLQKITKAMTKPAVLDKKLSMLSPKGLHLLKKFLTCNPDSRITAEEALNHDWFRET